MGVEVVPAATLNMLDWAVMALSIVLSVLGAVIVRRSEWRILGSHDVRGSSSKEKIGFLVGGLVLGLIVSGFYVLTTVGSHNADAANATIQAVEEHYGVTFQEGDKELPLISQGMTTTQDVNFLADDALLRGKIEVADDRVRLLVQEDVSDAHYIEHGTESTTLEKAVQPPEVDDTRVIIVFIVVLLLSLAGGSWVAKDFYRLDSSSAISLVTGFFATIFIFMVFMFGLSFTLFSVWMNDTRQKVLTSLEESYEVRNVQMVGDVGSSASLTQGGVYDASFYEGDSVREGVVWTVEKESVSLLTLPNSTSSEYVEFDKSMID